MYLNPIFLKTVPANVEGRDFVVGDIHGCFDELGKLLLHVKFDPNYDRLFSTGDLIDRGPRSLECFSLLNKKWFYSVLGNHEDLFLSKVKILNSEEGNSMKAKEIEYIQQLSEFIPNILQLPLVYEVEHLLLGKIYILHSEILPEHLEYFGNDELGNTEYERFFNALKEFDFSKKIESFFKENTNKTLDYHLKQKLLWSRKIITSFYKDHKDAIDKGDFSFMKREAFSQELKVFCGHNVVPFPMKIGQQYYIDTGAALGYSSKELNSYLFTQFGHEFFTLSMVDITTGFCYACVTSPEKRHHIVRLENSLYD